MTDEAQTPKPKPPRWRRVWGWVWPLLLLPVFMMIVGRWRAPDLPEMAPEFTVRSIDGAEIRLADYRGKTVLLNFWATWCGPCRAEMPSLASFARDNPEIVVLGLASDSEAAVREWVTEKETPYPNAIAPRSLLATYQIETYPTTVVVGPDGAVRVAHTGIALGPQFWWLTRP